MAVNEQDLLIIREVENNPILWDTRLSEYKNTKAKEVTFLVIAEKLGLNVQDVEARWKNLRKLYIRKRKHSIDKGGSGATSYWPVYRYLNFLAPTVRHRYTPKKRPVVIKCAQTSQEVTDEDEEEELNEEGQLEMEPFKVEQLETERQIHSDEASSSLPSPNLQPKSPSLKSRRVTIERMMHNFSKNSEEKDVNVANNEDAYNLDFFKSLLPLIRGWTNLAKIEFRTDVLGLIKRYNETQNW